jgi:DNA polymerase V
MQLELLPLQKHSQHLTWLASVSVPAGDPADISADVEQIDLNEYLTGGRDGVYMIRAGGDSMETAIQDGDLLVVNRNLEAQAGDIIIASVNGSLTVKTFQPSRTGLRLVAKNEKYEPRKVTGKDNFEVFGVVTDVVHRLRRI